MFLLATSHNSGTMLCMQLLPSVKYWLFVPRAIIDISRWLKGRAIDGTIQLWNGKFIYGKKSREVLLT